MRSIAVLTSLLLLCAATQPLRSHPAIHPVSAQEDSEQDVSSNGYANSSYLGVAVVPLNDEMLSELKLRDGQGALVRWVAEGSPASKAGVRPNDIILQFNGHDINDVSDLGRLVHQAPPGRKAKLRMIRDGKVMTIAVTPVALRAPSAPAGNSIRLDLAAPDFFTSDMPLPALFWRSNFLGIEYESIDAQLAAFFGVKQGLLVRYVLERSAAQAAGLRAGDVLVKVANRQCVNPRDVGQALRNRANPGKPIPLEIVRDGKTRTLVLNTAETRNQPSPE
jgi:serine protease Do